MSANQPTGKAIKPRASGHDRLSHVGNIGTITLLRKEDEIEELKKETLGHHSRQVKERKVKEIVKSTGVRERAGGADGRRRIWDTLKEQHS